MATIMKRFTKGVVLKGETADVTENAEGSLFQNSSELRLKAYIEGAVRQVVTNNQSQVLTNKTIDADNNSVSNIQTSSLKAGVLNTSTSLASASNTQVPSALAVKTYVDDKTAAQNEASEISFAPAGTIAATTVQAMGQELDGDIQGHISDATDAHAASAITNTPSGNLAATTVQAALDELQSDVDSRATTTALTNHTTASANVHGLAVGSSVVGTTDSQALTNKTITGADIRTPVRSDVKQDTKANLTTYAITASNGQLAFATDTKEMFQVVDGLLESVGGGEGIGGVDILFTQTFETAALSDFTQTGLSLSTSAPLHGEVSALLTHQPATSQSFKQVIAVDRKFRSQSMVMRLNVKSNASAGNVVLNVYDETNAANLVASEQLQLSNDVNGEVNSVGFTIPETCASLSYTITALQEAGSPVTRVDDVIAELAVTALLETSVEVPNITAWQGYTPTFQGFGTPSAVEFEWRQVGENVEIRGKFTSGTSTAVQARIGLPGGLTSAGTSVIPSLQIVGSGTLSTASANPRVVFINPSVTYFTVGTGGDGGLAELNANGFISSGQTCSFFASAPCAGLSATTTKVIPLTQSGLVQNPDSYIRLYGANGYGSTATKIPRLATVDKSLGSDVLYQDSAINGASFTIQTAGIYDIALSFDSSPQSQIGLSLNSSQLTTNVNAISIASRLAYGVNTAGFGSTVSHSGYFNAGDVIRPHTDGAAISALSNFSISKQSSLKQVTVNPNSKMTLPSSELRMEGITGRGSTDTRVIQYSAISAIRGDAFTVVSNAVNGTIVTITKDGKISINANAQIAAGELFISRNQAVLTSNPVASETLGYSFSPSSADAQNVGFVGTVRVGDILRITSSSAPSASSGNLLTILHEETSIGVAVSNTLPQFSESDSSVRVAGSNGFGSTNTQNVRFSNVLENIGGAVTYSDSATTGMSCLINEDGLYSFSTFGSSGGTSTDALQMEITKNAVQFVTPTDSSSVLAYGGDRVNTNTTNTKFANPAGQAYLVKGDVIRVAANTSVAGSQFFISKVGKPNVTGVDVTPFVNIPSPNTTPWQRVTLTSTWTNLTLTGAARRNGDSMDLRVYGVLTGTPSGGGLYIDMPTFNGAAIVVDSAKIPGAASNYVYVSSGYLRDAGTANYTPVMAVYDSTTRFGFSYGTALNGTNPTSPFTFASGDFFNISIQGIPVVGWDVVPNQIVSATETFSTDTASLTYAGSAQYTLSTLANAPVGTFITFTYASSSNTRTQTNAAAPSQTTSSMAINGIQLFARAYNAASTSGNPASIAMQIGKGLKGLLTSGYSATAKSGAIALDMFIPSTTVQRGTVVTYEESTGILQIDCAAAEVSTNTARSVGQDATGSAVSNGYIVINASKSPALTGVPLLQPKIATLSDQKASGTSGPNSTAGTFVTRELNTLSDPSGIVTSLSSNQFNLPAGEYYVEASAPGHGNGPSTMGGHKIRIRNITDSTTSLVGSSERSTTVSGVGITTKTVISGVISISSSKVFELQHFAQSSATGGFGFAVSSGDPEVYSIVKITKIK